MASLDFTIRTTPKAGHAPDENEDAAAADLGRAAVADGASEGWQSGPWARAVAAAFVRSSPTPATFADWLTAVRSDAAPVAGAPGPPRSWYAEAKAEQGAFATLLGVTFEDAPADGVKWRAVAVGDSCLFQVRGGALVARFPIESAADFSNRPGLIGSKPAAGGPDPAWFAGRAEPGDRFYLLTDALAEWFLRSAAAGGSPWAELDRVTAGDAAGFAAWVQALRDARAARNDDATAVVVRIVG